MLKTRIEFIRDFMQKQVEFPAECQIESEALPRGVNHGALTRMFACNRRDLRDLPTMTVDGREAKDLDDAVSLTTDSNACRHLFVHIADVSHYVRANTALDREAYARGNSYYLGETVLPMLPHRLSDDLCSLNPDTDKLTLTVELIYDVDGNFCGGDVYESVIRSDLRAVYTDLYNYFGQGELEDNLAYEKLSAGQLQNMPKKYRQLAPMICLAKSLAAELAHRRQQKGSIMFDLPELSFEFNEQHQPVFAGKHEITWANRLIEEFMIAANEFVAAYAQEHEIPIVYRTHGLPEADKFTAFLTLARSLNAKMPRHFNNLTRLQPKDVSRFLELNEEHPAFTTLQTMLLRSQAKAVYRKEPAGHFGLALADYCHFTSPIRRYSDLLTHRALKNYWHNRSNRRLAKHLAETCSYISEQERNAIVMERDVDAMLSAEYMHNFIGVDYTAKISGFVQHGLFLSLDNAIEGFLAFKNLADHFVFLPEKMQAVGMRSHTVLRLGESLKVELSAVNLESYLIDFIPLDPYLGKKPVKNKSKKALKKAIIKTKKESSKSASKSTKAKSKAKAKVKFKGAKKAPKQRKLR